MVKGELVSDDIRMKIELNLDTTVFSLITWMTLMHC